MVNGAMPLQNGLASSVAAFGNTTFHAFGMHMNECPIRPEMIVNTLRKKEVKEKRGDSKTRRECMSEPVKCPVCGKKFSRNLQEKLRDAV